MVASRLSVMAASPSPSTLYEVVPKVPLDAEKGAVLDVDSPCCEPCCERWTDDGGVNSAGTAVACAGSPRCGCVFVDGYGGEVGVFG